MHCCTCTVFHNHLTQVCLRTTFTSNSRILILKLWVVYFDYKSLDSSVNINACPPQISLAQDWTVFHDTLQHHISHAQDYLFFAYLPYLSVAFHFLFAAPSKPQIRYPHTSFEVRCVTMFLYLITRVFLPGHNCILHLQDAEFVACSGT